MARTKGSVNLNVSKLPDRNIINPRWRNDLYQTLCDYARKGSRYLHLIGACFNKRVPGKLDYDKFIATTDGYVCARMLCEAVNNVDNYEGLSVIWNSHIDALSILNAKAANGDDNIATPPPPPAPRYYDDNYKPVPPTPSPQATMNIDENRIRAIIDSAINSPMTHGKLIDALKDELIDAAKKAAIETIEKTKPTVIHIQRYDEKTAKNLGVQHFQFPELLKMIQARDHKGDRLNVWLYGPAGTGKTTAAENAAKALKLNFYASSAMVTKFEVTGFIDANSKVVDTQFRKAWEKGGVWIGDEFDASDSRALMTLNSALANGFCEFPDKVVRRHKDCVIIVGANTAGGGATINYSARSKLDFTTTDRFVNLAWPIDETLEAAICTNVEWLERVRSVRAKVAARIAGYQITPRASFYGASLLAAGVAWDTVEVACLRKGLSEEQWAQVK